HTEWAGHPNVFPEPIANPFDDGRFRLWDNFPFLLHNAGYRTAHIGKWHLGATHGMRPEDQGFDDSLYMAGTLYLPEDDRNGINAKRENDMVDRMVWATGRYRAQFNGGEPFKPGGYLTDYYTDEAVKVIESNRNRPFFLYLAHWGIHNPLQATKSDYDAFPEVPDHTLRVYSAMIRALDRGVGRVLAALDENGLRENTLVVFTSDNGGAGYIGLPDINKPYRGWKLTHFEGGTHVPFMARWPARIKPGTEVTAPIDHVDLYQTFAAAAGASVPNDRTLDGVDLLPFIRGEVTTLPHDTLFWREGHQQTVLHEGYKLIRAARPDKRWLFDLASDPTEQHNVAQAMPAKVSELEALLDAHNAEMVAPLWPSVIDAPQLIDKTGAEAYEPGDDYIYWPN
ncbi:MAG: sulfatase-like hydrolase/transferase, partial [Pseudomonadales bacterium]|nr:sulfatase-like hydrolase/transferase [Pseudomonadales bacterium]